jgi:hypothetical protein
LKIQNGYSSIRAVGGSSTTIKIIGDDIGDYYGHLLLSHPGDSSNISRTYELSGYIVFHKPVADITVNVTAPAVVKDWDA